jgi:Protein of unknown function (DUF2510)
MSETPPGWYPNPDNPQAQRYWDGAQWTDHEAPAVAAAPPPAVVQQPLALNPYDKFFNVDALPAEQREAYKQHQLAEFPSWAVVVLSIITLGLFGLIYHGLKHSQLPLIKSDDFTAGKSIGFAFIPFFNLYWLFVNWPRLAERINFQFRLRGAPEPVSKELILWANILWVAGSLVLVTWLVAPVLACISAAQIQSASNQLARGEVQPVALAPAPAQPGLAQPVGPAPPAG